MSQNKTLWALVAVVALSFTPHHARAQDEDAYDPFIDYSEYEEAGEEEADINFFRNGRFLTVGLNVGERIFTEGMGDVYKDDIGFGLYLSYFFDLRFALQFGYFTASHAMVLDGGTTKFNGNADISAISADIKYYVNTQNVTKGLAAVNPYFIFGLSSVSRDASIEGIADYVSDKAIGFDIGTGIEFPMMRNKMYFGAQALYQVVNFKDEGIDIGAKVGGSATGQFADGNFVILSAILGVNF